MPPRVAGIIRMPGRIRPERVADFVGIRISKQGDRYLRRLLVMGATAVIRHARTHPDKHPWVTKLLAKKPYKVVAVALANKMARIAWAILAKGETYRAPALAATV